MTETVLILGGGQLANELKDTAPSGFKIIYLNREMLDITQQEMVNKIFSQYSPSAVINAAAYTAVDKAETEKKLAFDINQTGVKNIINACQKINAYLLHISTDFVFDGQSNRPYKVDHHKNPLNVYGKSKSAGEDELIVSSYNYWGIIRTAWLYSKYGNNFVKTMLRLMQERDFLNVVGDQIGTPTWAKVLAEVCWLCVKESSQGIYHWTDEGVASWYDFAQAIQRQAFQQGLLSKKIPIKSIPVKEYPMPAKRPHYSVLDKSALLQEHSEITPLHWQDQLSKMLEQTHE